MPGQWSLSLRIALSAALLVLSVFISSAAPTEPSQRLLAASADGDPRFFGESRPSRIAAALTPSTAWSSRCEPRELNTTDSSPRRRPRNVTLALIVDAGITWVLLATELPRTCIGMNVYVFIADSGGALDTTATRKALARADGDADALPVRPYLHFFTRTSPRTVGDNVIYYCKDTLSPSCVHMERRLYLRYDVGTGMLVGRLVPDPSSPRYALEIRSRTSGCVVSDILHTQPFSTEEYTINMIAGNECRAEYASHPRPDLNSPSNWACRPLLHLNMPAAHDLIVSLPLKLPNALGIAPGTTLGHNRRVWKGQNLTAHYGINTFLVTYPESVAGDFPVAVKAMTLIGRVLNHEHVIGVNISIDHDDKLGGYLATVDIRDPGVYTLQVSLTTFFGDTKSFGEGVTPNSLCVGGHNMGFMPCDFKRSLIDGIPIQISTTFPAAGEAEQAAVPGQARHFGTRKCEDGTAVGRWVWMGNSTSESVECVPPFCTGNLSAGVTAEDLDGSTTRRWLWVPYDCYYHIYSKQDVLTCAQREGINWILSMGDSQLRTFSAWLARLSDFPFGKIIHGDMMLKEKEQKMRATWQFYWQLHEKGGQNMTRVFDEDRLLFDHYNLCPTSAEAAGTPLSLDAPLRYGEDTLTLPEETARPDVFVVNHGNVHQIWWQSWDTHKSWFHNFSEYTQGGRCWTSPPSFPGQRTGVSHPTTLVWVTSPYMHTPIWPPNSAVPGMASLTYNRHLRYGVWAHEFIKATQPGVRMVDALAITQVAWESTRDGVHYASWSDQLQRGIVAKMMAQVVMNAIFPTCDGT